MSRAAATGTTAGRGGRAALAALFVLGMALVLMLLVRARPGPEPFDPRSGASGGARALVRLLEERGADVAISRTPPAPGDDVRLLVLADLLDDAQRAGTLEFIEAGGVAVVADPSSSLHGGSGVDGGAERVTSGDLPRARLPVELEATVFAGECTIAALEHLRAVHIPDGLLFPVGPGEPRCFTERDVSFVIVRSLGSGTVVGLGDNEPFTNEHLRRADNGGLMAALLAPEGGGSVVVLLGTDANRTAADIGEGDETLFGLVPAWVWMALVLAAAAFVLFAVSRSVRVGRVVDEPLTSPIAGSELVAATGNLMQRARHASRAAWLLQVQLHRDLCRRFRLDASTSLDDVDRVVSSRSAVPPGTVEALLREQVADDAGLMHLSNRIDRLRKDVLP